MLRFGTYCLARFADRYGAEMPITQVLELLFGDRKWKKERSMVAITGAKRTSRI